MSDTRQPTDDKRAPRPCDFCGLPSPPSPVTAEHGGETYEFCSEICRRSLERNDYRNIAFHGFKRFTPSIPLLESQLPSGILRNSLVLISTEPGARGDAFLIELVWDTLQRGGSAVVVAYREPPVSVIEQFVSHRWNVIPYLEAEQLHIIDCFTYRVEDSERMVDRMNPWTDHLNRAAEGVTHTVRDPSTLSTVQNKLDDCIEANGIRESGIVVFDSLTEMGALVQPVQAYNFVKDIRADIAKGRFIPVFAHASYRGDDSEFPHDLEYMMDGVITMRFGDDSGDWRPEKRFSVRKMRGVPTTSSRQPYEYVGERGLVRSDAANGEYDDAREQ